jgi:hypothetical protein
MAKAKAEELFKRRKNGGSDWDSWAKAHFAAMAHRGWTGYVGKSLLND